MREDGRYKALEEMVNCRKELESLLQSDNPDVDKKSVQKQLKTATEIEQNLRRSLIQVVRRKP